MGFWTVVTIQRTTSVRRPLNIQSFSDANRSTGLKATCCPCFTYGKTQQRLRDPSLASYESFNNDCLIFAGASYCGLSWLYVSPPSNPPGPLSHPFTFTA
jgi:hypothetical protein